MTRRPRLYVNGVLTVSGAPGEDAGALLDEYISWWPGATFDRADATHALTACNFEDCDVAANAGAHEHRIEVRS